MQLQSPCSWSWLIRLIGLLVLPASTLNALSDHLSTLSTLSSLNTLSSLSSLSSLSLSSTLSHSLTPLSSMSNTMSNTMSSSLYTFSSTLSANTLTPTFLSAPISSTLSDTLSNTLSSTSSTFNTPFLSASALSTLESLRDEAISSIDFVREAYLPVSLETAVAIGVSEALAGAIGGLASRGAAKAIGDEKKDSLRTKVTSTSAFFGTRALIRASARLLGVPRPIAIVCASLVGSLVSETTKALGRESENTEGEELDVPEISGDVTKWIAYDVFYTLYSSDSVLEQGALSFAYGAASAVLGLVVCDLVKAVERRRGGQGDKAMATLMDKGSKRGSYSSYSGIALEGGVLFCGFQIILLLLQMVVPEQYNIKFAFASLVEQVERDISPDLR